MPNNHKGTCPLTQQELMDKYFMKYRAQVLSIAAFLDRMERASALDIGDDFRYHAFLKALQVLCSDEDDRTVAIQMILSDPRTDLLDERDQQNAEGASPHQEPHS